MTSLASNNLEIIFINIKIKKNLITIYFELNKNNIKNGLRNIVNL